MAADSPHNGRSSKVSMATAKGVPVFLILIVAYVSYILVGPLAISYLINNPDHSRQNIAAGIAFPIVWFFLLIPVAVTYIRLLLVVNFDAGYVPLGHDGLEKEPPPAFWMREVFVCDPSGWPIWCAYCKNWKPDRTHHNRDTGRCILKMDHFCPWVGGVVGERSIKFFLQFLVYALILTTYATILFGYYVAHWKHDVQWMVALGIAGFFTFFLLGMVINSFHLAAMGYTTVEHAGRSCTVFLAVLLPPDMQAAVHGRSPAIQRPARTYHSDAIYDEDSDRPLTSEIDDPSHSSYFSSHLNHGQNWPLRRASRSEYWRGTITYPFAPQQTQQQQGQIAAQPRTFAILEAPPGLNPWDLGSPWRNLGSIFGSKLHHWILPIRHAPAPEHVAAVSFYPLGPDFEWLLEESALRQTSPDEFPEQSTVSSRRRRRRTLPAGWQNGERPDGWWPEKEARRVRHEERRRRRESQRDVIL